VIPAPFDYVRAGTPAEAIEALGAHEDAKLLAGGHSLLPMMKVRLARPELLVDLAGLDELRYVRAEGDALAIGALTTHAQLATSDLVRQDAPLLAHSASLVGDPQVRHRGTIGGSLAHADPAADLPMAVLALGATLVLQGPDGRRDLAADDFFTGYFDTALGERELIVEVRVPRRPGAGWGYEKFVRRANDWAIVGVATTDGRVALANMGPTPLRASAAEAALAAGATVADAAALAAEGTEPVADLHADPEYRRHLARVLTRRALAAAQSLV
jgi:carbon-monoxide dehydrogenase medium subunit